MQEKRRPNIHYDKAYKWLFTYYLKDAIEFVHPTIFNLIDWNYKWIMQEQELENLAKTNDKLYTKLDKLIEFTLLIRNRVIILLHIEIQLTNPNEIAKRMFHYYLNLLNKYPNKDIHSLLVYIGKQQIQDMHIYNQRNESGGIKYDFTYFNLFEPRPHKQR